MDDFNFNIEDDILYCNQISKTEQPNIFHITKVPILTKEVFQQCYASWIVGKKGEDNNDTAAE